MELLISSKTNDYHTNKLYMHTEESVLENKTQNILRYKRII